VSQKNRSTFFEVTEKSIVACFLTHSVYTSLGGLFYGFGDIGVIGGLVQEFARRISRTGMAVRIMPIVTVCVNQFSIDTPTACYEFEGALFDPRGILYYTSIAFLLSGVSFHSQRTVISVIAL